MNCDRVIAVCCSLLAVAMLGTVEVSGQTVAQSFADLQPTLHIGQQVIVKGDDGRSTKGRVVSLVGSQLPLIRIFQREERRTFAEDSVDRIEAADSTWDGTAIGAGLGVLVMVLALNAPACNQPDDWSCAPFVLTPLAGAIAGSLIDGARTRPIYISGRKTGLSLSPLFDKSSVGLWAMFRV